MIDVKLFIIECINEINRCELNNYTRAQISTAVQSTDYLRIIICAVYSCVYSCTYIICKTSHAWWPLSGLRK